MHVHVLSLRAREARFKGSDFHSEQAFFCAEEPWPNQACHPEAGVLCPHRDLGEPRDVALFLRHDNRASGSLLYQQRSTSARANP
jgi:hypothetical protein